VSRSFTVLHGMERALLIRSFADGVMRSACYSVRFAAATSFPTASSSPRRWHPSHKRTARILWVSAMLFGTARIYAQQPEPRPPCGQEPVPAYPAVDASPVSTSWSRTDLGRDWSPPTCTGWSAAGFTTLITTVARFRQTSGADGLLRHIGAISELTGLRYWSATHKQWQTLILSAYALTGAQSGQHRVGFLPDEMKGGKVLYFEQTDNLAGKGVYRMHIAEASVDRIVFDVENVSTIRAFFVPILHPGDLQSIYFLDRESDSVWRYYSILRIGLHASSLTTAHDSSAVNRAAAFYRFLAAVPAGSDK
jgi:hypothetical protein